MDLNRIAQHAMANLSSGHSQSLLSQRTLMQGVTFQKSGHVGHAGTRGGLVLVV
jgi:hypothetical protein